MNGAFVSRLINSILTPNAFTCYQIVLAVCSLTYIEATFLIHSDLLSERETPDASAAHPLLVKPIFQKKVIAGSTHIAGGGEDDKDVLPLTSAKDGKRKRVGKIIGLL